MRFVLASARKDLRRIGRDRIALLSWLGIPVFIGVLMTALFGRGSVTPQGRLLVADEDASLVSSLVSNAFTQGQLGQMFQVEKVKQEDGRRRIGRGDASALLIIPKGFGQAFLKSEPARLQLLTNPSQQILPAIVAETLSILLEGAFYLQLVVGDELKLIAQGPPVGAGSFPDKTIADLSVRLNRLGEKLGAYLDPPLLELETSVVEEKPGIRGGFAAAFLPGALFMAVLFVAQGMVFDFWKERSHGTLRRLVVTGSRVEAFLAGKAMAAGMVLAMVAVVGLACARWLVQMPVSQPLVAVVWMTLSGTTLFLLLAIVALAASTERAASMLTSFVVLPLMMLGGSLFPFEAMPEGLARIGRLTPNGWALAQFRAHLDGSAESASVAAAFAGALLVATVTFAACSRRLRRFAV